MLIPHQDGFSNYRSRGVLRLIRCGSLFVPLVTPQSLQLRCFLTLVLRRLTWAMVVANVLLPDGAAHLYS